MSSKAITTRLEDAAKVLGVTKRTLAKVMSKIGITETEEGLSLLDAYTTNEVFLVSTMREIPGDVQELKMFAAAEILKGRDPFAKQEPKKDEKTQSTSSPDAVTAAVVEAIRSQKDINQMKDRELLDLYQVERDYEVEQLLHRKAKYQPFVVLEAGDADPGKEKINIEATLDLLKRARRDKTPDMVPVGDDLFPVYKITELNKEDRVIDLCPICGGTLYKSYCGSCQVNFSDIGEDEKAFLKLAVDKRAFNSSSFADNKEALKLARESIDALKKTWPAVGKVFDDLKYVNNLPKLRIMRSTPSRVSDPFNVVK